MIGGHYYRPMTTLKTAKRADGKELGEARRKLLIKIIAEMFDDNAADLARKVGRSDSQVSQWVSGERGIGNKIALLIEESVPLPEGAMLDPLRPRPEPGPFQVLGEGLSDEGKQKALDFFAFLLSDPANIATGKDARNYGDFLSSVITDMKKKREKK